MVKFAVVLWIIWSVPLTIFKWDGEKSSFFVVCQCQLLDIVYYKPDFVPLSASAFKGFVKVSLYFCNTLSRNHWHEFLERVGRSKGNNLNFVVSFYIATWFHESTRIVVGGSSFYNFEDIIWNATRYWRMIWTSKCNSATKTIVYSF